MSISFGDLTELKRIGNGSFGSVYKADYLGTDVAVKECEQLQDFDFEKYFEREVGLLREARHPNVVQFMGTCKHRGLYYIITEYVPNGNLRTYILKNIQPFDWRTRVSFIVDISRALAYLHNKGIIHRDLKGENLLITENLRVKVCDFGFARMVAQSEEEMRRLSYCGTDGYMAPEILMGLPFDTSIDVFSLGILICEIISQTVVIPEHIFKRHAPNLTPSATEIRYRAQKGCPDKLIDLAIQCTRESKHQRLVLKEILAILREVESKIIAEDLARNGGTVGSHAGTVDIKWLKSLYKKESKTYDVENVSDNVKWTVDSGNEIWNGLAQSDSSDGEEVLKYEIVDDSAISSIYLSPSGSVSTVTSSMVPILHSKSVILTTHDEDDDTPPVSQYRLPSYSTTVTKSRPKFEDEKVEEEGEGGTLKDDKLQGESSAPHRFTLVKNASSAKCAFCHKRISGIPGFIKYLECDDCNSRYHIRCAPNAPNTCTTTPGEVESDKVVAK